MHIYKSLLSLRKNKESSARHNEKNYKTVCVIIPFVYVKKYPRVCVCVCVCEYTGMSAMISVKACLWRVKGLVQKSKEHSSFYTT